MVFAVQHGLSGTYVTQVLTIEHFYDQLGPLHVMVPSVGYSELETLESPCQ